MEKSNVLEQSDAVSFYKPSDHFRHGMVVAITGMFKAVEELEYMNNGNPDTCWAMKKKLHAMAPGLSLLRLENTSTSQLRYGDR